MNAKSNTPFYYQDISQTAPELLEQFDCNSPNTSMNDFLKDEALKYHQNGQAVTKIIIDNASSKIIGYYTLKCSCLQMQTMNEFNGKTENAVIPAVELARFAIDQIFQGKPCSYYQNMKFSELVFDHVMEDITVVRENYAGIAAVLIFSVEEEKPKKFYRRLQFEEIDPVDCDVYQSPENDGCIAMYKLL